MLPNVNELMVEVLSPYAKGDAKGGEAKAEEEEPTAPTGGEEAK